MTKVRCCVSCTFFMPFTPEYRKESGKDGDCRLRLMYCDDRDFIARHTSDYCSDWAEDKEDLLKKGLTGLTEKRILMTCISFTHDVSPAVTLEMAIAARLVSMGVTRASAEQEIGVSLTASDVESLIATLPAHEGKSYEEALADHLIESGVRIPFVKSECLR